MRWFRSTGQKKRVYYFLGVSASLGVCRRNQRQKEYFVDMHGALVIFVWVAEEDNNNKKKYFVDMNGVLVPVWVCVMENNDGNKKNTSSCKKR